MREVRPAAYPGLAEPPRLETWRQMHTLLCMTLGGGPPWNPLSETGQIAYTRSQKNSMEVHVTSELSMSMQCLNSDKSAE
jgi:hypothetical protein